jgi:uncharacterized SAM-binding protein YcdF (DUF218 family)
VIGRLFGIVTIAWALGFAAFMLSFARPLGPDTTDAVVVLTGGAGRLDRGLELLRGHVARRMLVTGVAPGVRATDLARRYQVSPALFACCVDLGPEAVDTRSNAIETARWVKEHRYTSLRIVTSDWHMPRALMEFRAALGPGVTILGDGVPSSAPRFGQLINEYDKLLLRRVALWLGIGR